MRSPLLALIFALSLSMILPFAAHAERIGDHFMWVERYGRRGGEDPRSILMLQTYDRPLPGAPVREKMEPGYVGDLLEYLENWVTFQFLRHGVVKDDARAKALAETGSLKDMRSSFVLITDYNDLGKIRALLRISRPGDRPETKRLPLEAHLNIDLPRPELTLPADGNRLFLHGDIAELKNFVHDPEKGMDYIPLLFQRAFARNFFEGPFKLVRYKGETRTLVPSVFYLHCDMNEKVRRYYESLGFKMYRESPETKSYVMSINREGLFEIPKILGFRPGQKLIDERDPIVEESNWQPARIKSVSCSQMLRGLSEKIPFFKKGR